MAQDTKEPMLRTSGVYLSSETNDGRVRRHAHSPDRLLSVSEAAECVGCCEETLRRAYLAGHLQILRFGGGRVRIHPAALFAWLERGGKTTPA